MKQYLKKIGFKKTVWATVALLSVSNQLSAAAYLPPVKPLCSAETPCERNAWGVGLEGLWVKPAFGTDAGYAYSFINETDPETGLIRIGRQRSFAFDPASKFGFRLEGTYRLKDGRDLSLNWTHFSTNTERFLDRNQLRQGPNEFDERGFLSPYLPFLGIFTIVFPYDTIHARSEIKFDAVNLEYGKSDLPLPFLSEGSRFRYYASLQYVNIRNNVNVKGTWKFFDLIGEGEGGANMSFRGLGPRLGADLDIDVAYGFSVVGRGAAALLVGKNNIDTRTREFIGLPGETPVLDRITTKNLSHITVVPGLEVKLGAKYAYAGAFGVFSVEGGWQAASYINALSTNPITGVVPDTNNSSATALTFVKSNFGYQGPYLGVKLLANA